MKYRIWYSTESFADYIIANTALRNKTHEKRKLYESDANNANNFHSLPDHKQVMLGYYQMEILSIDESFPRLFQYKKTECLELLNQNH